MASLEDPSLLHDFVQHSDTPGLRILDGGLATHLEILGYDLNHHLWSARLLDQDPSAIVKAHRDYLEAGAEIIITASYQASIEGIIKYVDHINDESSALKLIGSSVTLAKQAINEYQSAKGTTSKDCQILIAGSLGCFGATLHNGAEYTGVYGKHMTLNTLKDFHRKRMISLHEFGADLIAAETIPNVLEVRAVCEIMDECEIEGWITMSCMNENQLNSGEKIIDAIEWITRSNYVTGVGINCSKPSMISDAIKQIKQSLQRFESLMNDNNIIKSIPKKNKEKILIVYPNSGESWDGIRHCWVKNTSNDHIINNSGSSIMNKNNHDSIPSVNDVNFIEMAKQWRDQGASIIGGCCRTTPNTIQLLKQGLKLTLSLSKEAKKTTPTIKDKRRSKL